MRLHPLQGQPRRDGEGNQQRQGHAQAGIDRNGAHVGAHEARHKGHGQQGCNDGERGQNGGATHFINSGGNDVLQRFFRVQLLMAVNVFHHHNGIVHQNAN